MTAQIAIIGAGPSGFYAADTFAKKLPDCRIDIIDRLPTPFGLVRAGVAPDHQGTKNVSRQFERTLQNPAVRFIGNVEIGKDVQFDQLKDLYDIIFLSIGASKDRRLGIPGEEARGVYGSAEFVGWYNGHPDFVDLNPLLGPKGVAIIGNGNVAIDIVRVLAKTESEMDNSDLCHHAEETIRKSDLSQFHMVGRRGPAQAAFTPSEANELGHLSQCDVHILGGDLNETPNGSDPKAQKNKEKNLEILREIDATEKGNKPKVLNLQFWAKPVEILSENGLVTGLKLERTTQQDGRVSGTGEFITLDVSTVISAIGYETVGFAGLPMDNGIVKNIDGWVEDGVYVSGWCMHGPQGTIPTNRKEAMTIAQNAINGFNGPSGKSGGTGLDRLLDERGVTRFDFDSWKRIEAAEEANARPNRVREKITRRDVFLSYR